jgi:hypothetical protein
VIGFGMLDTQYLYRRKGMAKHSRLSTAFFLILVLFPVLCSSQSRETGIIQGTVSDESGVPLPGVSIGIISPSLMGARTTVTDQTGRYRFPALPTGTYEVESTLSGFSTVKVTSVVVHAGTTGTVDIVMTPAKLAAEVLVIGEAPLVDVTDASIGRTYFTKDFLDNIPTSRDTFRMINAAPGVTSLSAYGSGDHTGNLYQVDGVEIIDSWFGGGMYTATVDYDIIEESQFVALGAPAEYGNFTGSLVNIVTKSGGNSFNGDAHVYYKGSNWQSSHVDKDAPEWSLLAETPVVETLDVGFHLGGPLLKDKLWFFGGYNYFKSTEHMVSLNKTRPLWFPKAFLKLTFQPDEKNRFNASMEYHKSTQENMTWNPLVPTEANYKFVYPVWIGNFSFLHTFSPQTILDLKFAGNYIINDYIPNSGRDLPAHYDLVTGLSSVNNDFWAYWTSSRYALNATLSHYVDDFIKGSHDFKFGVEVERARGGGTSDPTGGYTFWDLNGEPFMAYEWSYKSDGLNWRYTGFAQDDWKISESLVLNPGLRFSLIRGSIPDLSKTFYTPNNLEPRIGAVWDVAKDHKTVVKFHYGRYFEGSKSYYFSNLQPSPDSVYYTVGPNWSSKTEDYRISGASRYSIDPDTKHPSMDQVVAGVERVLGKDITVGVSFVYRYWKNFIEAVNTTALFEEVSFTDPGTGQVFTVYNQTNPGDNHYYITNPKVGVDYGQAYADLVQVDLYRKYRGIQFTFNKRFSNKWQFSASYVFSKEDGTYGNSHSADLQRGWMGHQTWNMCGASIFYDPTRQINLYGHSSISSPHVFKALATYVLPLDISLSAFYTYTSGRRWERNILLTDLNQVPYLMTEPRGERSLKAQNNLDLRAEKSFRFNQMRFSLVLDLFNLFNQARMVQVMDIVGANFGKGLNVNTPRTFRASLSFYF